jgi:hypothetical protein
MAGEHRRGAAVSTSQVRAKSERVSATPTSFAPSLDCSESGQILIKARFSRLTPACAERMSRARKASRPVALGWRVSEHRTGMVPSRNTVAGVGQKSA